jgi:hypothetical protein
MKEEKYTCREKKKSYTKDACSHTLGEKQREHGKIQLKHINYCY